MMEFFARLFASVKMAFLFVIFKSQEDFRAMRRAIDEPGVMSFKKEQNWNWIWLSSSNDSPEELFSFWNEMSEALKKGCQVL